jgi:hypothetical protein
MVMGKIMCPCATPVPFFWTKKMRRPTDGRSHRAASIVRATTVGLGSVERDRWAGTKLSVKKQTGVGSRVEINTRKRLQVFWPGPFVRLRWKI